MTGITLLVDEAQLVMLTDALEALNPDFEEARERQADLLSYLYALQEEHCR